MRWSDSLLLLLACLNLLENSGIDAIDVIDLSSNWTLTNDEFGIAISNISLPNSVHSILVANEFINEPLSGYNDVNFRWIVYADGWVLSKRFHFESKFAAATASLSLDAVDTLAAVFLNGRNVLNTSNQFVTYELNDLKDVFFPHENVIEVRFESSVKKAQQLALEYPYKVPPKCPPKVQHGECQVNFLRKQQCSFSWDWGPAFAPIGINGPVLLQLLEAADDFTFDFSVTVYAQDPHSSAPLTWTLDLDVQVNQSASFAALARLQANIDALRFSKDLSLNISSPNERIRVKVEMGSVPDESLWWPAGYGKQNVYELELVLSLPGFTQTVRKSKRIGFRLVELIQKPVDEANKANGLTFYFSINKQPIFLKGSNWIPADSFQEQITTDKLKWLLKSAVLANMNVLRVWGGGVYEKEEFYDLADQMGIMIWQDFMFACGTYPTNPEFLDNVAMEVQHQMSRLKHHVSIIVWAANNENEVAISTNWYDTDVDRPRYTNDYRELYIKTIMPAVERLDPPVSRPFLGSSPTNGLESIDENWIAANPYDLKYGDMHFYDYRMNGWLPESFPVPRLMSEYGVQSMPSLATLAQAYALPQDADFFGSLNTHRQHHGGGNDEIKNEIENNMRMPSESLPPIDKFKAVIYLSQINQAMHYKTGIEVFRRARNAYDPATGHGYCMGSMYWQFNDLWQAPTWATIEYHKEAGKWKMAHYFAKNAYAPLLISPVLNATTNTVDFYSLSDLFKVARGRFALKVFSYDSFDARLLRWIDFTAQPFTSAPVASLSVVELEKETNCRFGSSSGRLGLSGGDSCLLTIDDGNFMFFNNRLADVTNLRVANLTIEGVKAGESKGEFLIRVKSDQVALFVWLDLTTTSFCGIFSDNGFHMTAAERTVVFITDSEQVNPTMLLEYLSVQTLANLYQ